MGSDADLDVCAKNISRSRCPQVPHAMPGTNIAYDLLCASAPLQARPVLQGAGTALQGSQPEEIQPEICCNVVGGFLYSVHITSTPPCRPQAAATHDLCNSGGVCFRSRCGIPVARFNKRDVEDPQSEKEVRLPTLEDCHKPAANGGPASLPSHAHSLWFTLQRQEPGGWAAEPCGQAGRAGQLPPSAFAARCPVLRAQGQAPTEAMSGTDIAHGSSSAMLVVASRMLRAG
eukprot:2686548-Rhodomonas_salina.2